MSIVSKLSHVAVLVPSVQRSASCFAKLGIPVGPAEEWDGEGTREIYVGDKNHSGLLLLMEPIKQGAYSRAMAKRGPGLHHIAIDVVSLETFIAGISNSGWLLHPRSLATIQKNQTAYLARPGMRMLVEVQERNSIEESPPVVLRLEMPFSKRELELLGVLGLGSFFCPTEAGSWLTIGENRIAFGDFLVG